MTTTSAQNRERETAYLGAHATAFLCSEHLSGRARIGGMTEKDARAQLDEASEHMGAILATLKPMR